MGDINQLFIQKNQIKISDNNSFNKILLNSLHCLICNFEFDPESIKNKKDIFIFKVQTNTTCIKASMLLGNIVEEVISTKVSKYNINITYQAHLNT